jgi:3-deoxy-manno-octulosonate cytidylyltransferase (CMP-KDO synthetase)
LLYRMTVERPNVVAAIPARWGSTRFPGKALATIAGAPMIAHVVRRALSAAAVDHVVVATDDERVAAAAAAAGAESVMTGEHPSGTDRIAEAVSGGEWDIVVNIQGDEPMLSAANIDTLVDGMSGRPELGLATLCRPLAADRVDDPNAVKVVMRIDGCALYFSRSAVPFPRNRQHAEPLWRLHLGIYGFRPETLTRFVSLEPSSLERAEGLEQLRALENGIEILVLAAPDPAHGVDTPEDLERVERLMIGGD